MDGPVEQRFCRRTVLLRSTDLAVLLVALTLHVELKRRVLGTRATIADSFAPALAGPSIAGVGAMAGFLDICRRAKRKHFSAVEAAPGIEVDRIVGRHEDPIEHLGILRW